MGSFAEKNYEMWKENSDMVLIWEIFSTYSLHRKSFKTLKIFAGAYAPALID